MALNFGSIEIAIPKELRFIDKKGKIKLVPSTSKKGSLTSRLKEKSIKIMPRKSNKVEILNSGSSNPFDLIKDKYKYEKKQYKSYEPLEYIEPQYTKAEIADILKKAKRIEDLEYIEPLYSKSQVKQLLNRAKESSIKSDEAIKTAMQILERKSEPKIMKPKILKKEDLEVLEVYNQDAQTRILLHFDKVYDFLNRLWGLDIKNKKYRLEKVKKDYVNKELYLTFQPFNTEIILNEDIINDVVFDKEGIEDFKIILSDLLRAELKSKKPKKESSKNINELKKEEEALNIKYKELNKKLKEADDENFDIIDEELNKVKKKLFNLNKMINKLESVKPKPTAKPTAKKGLIGSDLFSLLVNVYREEGEKSLIEELKNLFDNEEDRKKALKEFLETYKKNEEEELKRKKNQR